MKDLHEIFTEFKKNHPVEAYEVYGRMKAAGNEERRGPHGHGSL